MRSVEFFKLSRAVQDRFIGSTRGAIPAPLLVAPVRPRSALVWWSLGGVALAAELAVAAIGYGRLSSNLALQASPWLAVHAGLLTVFAFCIAWALGLQQRYVALPYRPWIYLFPGSLVDARSPSFRVVPITEFRDVQLHGETLLLRCADGLSFEFPAATAQTKQDVNAAIEAARYRLGAGDDATLRSDVAGYDPLADTGYTNPFSPETAIRLPKGLPLPVALGIALIVGCILGSAVWKVRNQSSESTLFGAAVRSGTPTAFRTYLARGGTRPEVSSHLLPRAELLAARATGTLAALEAFERAHPSTSIRAEVDTVYRDLLLTELNKARSVGTLAALADFERTHARAALVAAEVGVERHAIFQRTQADFDARNTSLEVKRFVARLVARAETTGPRVSIRFRRRLAASTKEVEVAVMTNEYYTNGKQLPRNNFSDEESRRREELAAKTLVAGLQPAFPGEVISFELGAALAADEELGTVTEPTLFIDRRLQLSGLYPKKEPRGVYVAVETTFQAQFLLPGDTEPLTLSLTTLRPPPLKVLEVEGAQPIDVYDRMEAEAFEKLTAALLALLVGAPS
jgi:hypothetical protein